MGQTAYSIAMQQMKDMIAKANLGETALEKVNEQLADIATNLNARSINVKFPPAPLVAAMGDGVTDDTDAIQAVLDYIYVNGGGGAYFPLGIYRITRPLFIKSIAPFGGYSYAPIALIGEGNNASVIKKDGETQALGLDASCIIIRGDTMVITDDWSAIQFTNIKVDNQSNGSLTYGVYGHTGSRLICNYATFETSKSGIAVGSRDRYALYIHEAWAWSFRDCTFIGDYGFYNGLGGTSLLLENTFANTEKIAYRVASIYSTMVNVYGDFCKGTMFYFNFAEVDCTNLGCESPDLTYVIWANNSKVVINKAKLWQPAADTGAMLVVRGSHMRITHLDAYMATGSTRGYLWWNCLSGFLTIDTLTLSGSGNRFKYLDESPTLSVDAFVVRVFNHNMARTNGLLGVMPYRNEYWDWYVETPTYPINNLYLGLRTPTENAKGQNVAAEGGGTPNGIYFNADFANRLILGWARITHGDSSLNNGQVRYIPLILSGTTAQRPVWQTTGMNYFDTTLNKPIWWNGTNWVDATGTTV
ncbi:glycosyl hydrolase family 28-related protein [Paenibacillus sp. CAU 1782]